MRLPILLPNIFDYPFTYKDKVFNSLKPGDFVKVMFGSKEQTGVVWNFEQPIEKKMESLHPVQGTPRGYRILAGEALGRAAVACKPPDLKEFYHIGPDGWPNDEYHTGREGQKYFIPNIFHYLVLYLERRSLKIFFQ